ncbi:hypothetical protein [Thalassotalea castellviae]|uniref:Uncharacterized protein n=1 Tax=Thalassotalea castellviae TaxID=3075612 RepID=A0ABU2ZXC4_9GAMM|nr:hypothetical protein [Thalassotalea sp. W431]MDT0602340.1 hypothetical protein [Thalassotalea sp. W431]
MKTIPLFLFLLALIPLKSNAVEKQFVDIRENITSKEFYVGLVSRQNYKDINGDEVSSLSGHAFVVIGRPINNRMTIQEVIGYYPKLDAEVISSIVVPTEDELRNDWFNGSLDSSLNQLFFRVDENQLKNAKKTISGFYNDGDYSLGSRDCLSLVMNVGKSIGIKMPLRYSKPWFYTINQPLKYLDYLIELAKSRTDDYNFQLENGNNVQLKEQPWGTETHIIDSKTTNIRTINFSGTDLAEGFQFKGEIYENGMPKKGKISFNDQKSIKKSWKKNQTPFTDLKIWYRNISESNRQRTIDGQYSPEFGVGDVTIDNETFLYEGAVLGDPQKGKYKLHGMGAYTVKSSKTKYIGYFENSEFMFGNILYTDGTIYEGELKDGKYQGYGSLYYPNQSSVRGYFDKGNLKPKHKVKSRRGNTTRTATHYPSFCKADDSNKYRCTKRVTLSGNKVKTKGKLSKKKYNGYDSNLNLSYKLALQRVRNVEPKLIYNDSTNKLAKITTNSNLFKAIQHRELDPSELFKANLHQYSVNIDQYKEKPKVKKDKWVMEFSFGETQITTHEKTIK